MSCLASESSFEAGAGFFRRGQDEGDQLLGRQLVLVVGDPLVPYRLATNFMELLQFRGRVDNRYQASCLEFRDVLVVRFFVGLFKFLVGTEVSVLPVIFCRGFSPLLKNRITQSSIE